MRIVHVETLLALLEQIALHRSEYALGEDKCYNPRQFGFRQHVKLICSLLFPLCIKSRCTLLPISSARLVSLGEWLARSLFPVGQSMQSPFPTVGISRSFRSVSLSLAEGCYRTSCHSCPERSVCVISAEPCGELPFGACRDLPILYFRS